MDIRVIEWQDALLVRHNVLWPDKSVSFCRVEGDELASHYGVYRDGNLVSVASIYKTQGVARLRKFATLELFQGQGMGSTLIKHIMRELKEEGMISFWCDARATAVGFYEKLGMTIQGNEFNKSGVLYFKMEMNL